MFEFIKKLLWSKKSLFQEFFPDKKDYDQRVQEIIADLSPEEKKFAKKLSSEIYTYDETSSVEEFSTHIINKYRYPHIIQSKLTKTLYEFMGLLIAPQIKCSTSSAQKKPQTPIIKELVSTFEEQRKSNAHLLFLDMHLAYANKELHELQTSPDVAAICLRLSSAHKKIDICDLYAHADFWGLGAGIYPKNKFPRFPLHKGCMCMLEAVFYWEVSQRHPKFNSSGADHYLLSLSLSDRKSILGDYGLEKWKNDKNWLDCIEQQFHDDDGIPETIAPILSEIENLSLPARYHFLDIMIYTTYANPYHRIWEMTHYSTRKNGIDITRTSEEILKSGLVEIIHDPKIILNSYTKSELMKMHARHPKKLKVSWKKETMISFILENFTQDVNNLVAQSKFIKLTPRVEKVRDPLIAYCKERLDLGTLNYL